MNHADIFIDVLFVSIVQSWNCNRYNGSCNQFGFAHNNESCYIMDMMKKEVKCKLKLTRLTDVYNCEE